MFGRVQHYPGIFFLERCQEIHRKGERALFYPVLQSNDIFIYIKKYTAFSSARSKCLTVIKETTLERADSTVQLLMFVTAEK